MARLAISRAALRRLSKLAGIPSDARLARRMDIHNGQLWRVLAGKSEPGPRFIVGLIEVFGTEWLADLLVVVPDDNVADCTEASA